MSREWSTETSRGYVSENHDHLLSLMGILKANVLIDETKRARLADFGLLTIVSDTSNVISSIIADRRVVLHNQTTKYHHKLASQALLRRIDDPLEAFRVTRMGHGIQPVAFATSSHNRASNPAHPFEKYQ